MAAEEERGGGAFEGEGEEEAAGKDWDAGREGRTRGEEEAAGRAIRGISYERTCTHHPLGPPREGTRGTRAATLFAKDETLLKRRVRAYIRG